MRRISSITLVLFFLTLLATSCKKDSDSNQTTNPTPEQLLTSSAWKIDELRWMQYNSSNIGASYYYKKGVTSNIANLDNENILFSGNNIGTYTLGSSSYPITWQFTNPDKTKLQFIITYSPGNTLSVNWENIFLSSTLLRYSEYYTTNTGIVSLASGSRIH